MKRLTLSLILSLAAMGTTAGDSTNTYPYRSVCPGGGSIEGGEWVPYNPKDPANSAYWQDKWHFAQCNCTSYVAHKLNEAWGNTVPKFSNSYYGQRWGSAAKWLNAARASEIGVTAARDKFVFDKSRFNGAFKGDIAVWEAWSEVAGKRKANPFGHVAFVESDGEPDGASNGVKCIEVSEYNFDNTLNFGTRMGSKKVCKSADPKDVHFPNYFIHITQDREYCLRPENKQIGSCPRIEGKVAAGGEKLYGVFGGAGSDPFNLRITEFWVRDSGVGYTLVPDGHTVMTGQAIQPRIQVEAVNGDTHDHMRKGKDRIEIDLYVQEDGSAWRFLKRERIKATNLPNRATHTEHFDYVVPPGVSEVSFKATIDVEDEAFEANEGDNLSQILTFQVNNNPTVDLTVVAASVMGTSLPIISGGSMGAQTIIRNIGNSAPRVESRLEYAIRGPGTNNLWLPIASDGSRPEDLIPGQDHEERIQQLVPAPTMPGVYELKVTADYQNIIAESNESNNTFTTTFVVIPRPALRLNIVRFEDKVGCCTTNTGAAPKPRIWVQNSGSAAPGANVPVIYQIASPTATGGAYILMGYGTIEPRELPPGSVDEDQMDCDGCWRIPKTSSWKKQWHSVRACLRPDGGTPVGDPNQGEVCAYYNRYSKE